MGLFDWLKRTPSNRGGGDTVPLYDVESGNVVQIPRSELSSHAIQAQIQGMDGLVWVLPEQLQEGPVRHEPFSEEIRDYLRHIQSTFAEHRDLTVEEWEDGFRRDLTPESEIAIWLHAADIYLQFTADEASPERRDEVYRCLITCMTTSSESVWDILRPQMLDHSEAEQIVDLYFGKGE